MKFSHLSAIGLLFASSAALAQPAPANEAANPAAPTADAQAAGSYTPQEIESFAMASTKAREISVDATLDEQQKQEAMLAAVQEAGLDPARFNQIAEAAQTDPAVREQIEAALAQQPAGAP